MNESESQAWLGLIGVTQLLPAALDAELQRDAGLTHFEFMVLTMLRWADESTLPAAQLARQTNATLPRLSHVCAKLEKRGLIERERSLRDKRVTLVRLSTEGRRALVLAMPGHISMVRSLVIDALSPEQLASLTEITEVILERLGETPGPPRSGYTPPPRTP